jgi:hypothetical protein
VSAGKPQPARYAADVADGNPVSHCNLRIIGLVPGRRAHKISTELHTMDEGFMRTFTRLVPILWCLLARTIQATDPVTLLQQRCAACHGESNGVSGLKMNSRDNLLKGGKRGPAIIPGNSADSLLFRAVARLGDLKMPPNAPLTAC